MERYTQPACIMRIGFKSTTFGVGGGREAKTFIIPRAVPDCLCLQFPRELPQSLSACENNLRNPANITAMENVLIVLRARAVLSSSDDIHVIDLVIANSAGIFLKTYTRN